MSTTAAGEVINAIVAALTPALAPVPVFDGTPVNTPADLSYVIIGGDIDPDAEICDLMQEWHGLGLKSRHEDIHIKCVAVGRASTPPEARDLSLAVIQSVGANLPAKPTTNTFNALISGVDRMVAPRSQAGITHKSSFTILVKARLLFP